MLLGTTLLLAALSLPAEDLARGRVLDRVACRADGAQAYALYIPSAYDPARSWPVLYVFDPGGRGREAVARFQDAAEARGVLVACSLNSRNGPWPPIFTAMAAVWEDTHGRFRIDDHRIFAAGFSGGARAASVLPKMIGAPAAGIIACGAGLAEGQKAEDLDAGAFCAVVGAADFNYREVMDLRERLDGRPDMSLWFRVFEGAHSWPPAPVCGEALEWLELVTAKRSGETPDPELATALVARTASRAAALDAGGDAFRAVAELESAVSAFSGLADVGELRAEAARIRRSKAYDRGAREDRESERRERTLLDGLYRILTRLERSMLLRHELAELFSDIDRLVAEVKGAPDAEATASARRTLLSISVNAGEQAARLLKAKAPGRAVLCAELAARASAADPGRYGGRLYDLACAQALNGEVRPALDSLRRAVANGFADKDLLLGDEDLASLRGRPEFKEIVAGLK